MMTLEKAIWVIYQGTNETVNPGKRKGWFYATDYDVDPYHRRYFNKKKLIEWANIVIDHHLKEEGIDFHAEYDKYIEHRKAVQANIKAEHEAKVAAYKKARELEDARQ